MPHRWSMLLLGALATAALVAAACAPASESDDGATIDSGSSTTTTTTTTGPSVTEVQQAGQTTETTTASSSSTTTAKPGVETSVSGIPLDPDAKYGGVLLTSQTSEGPSFLNWEEAAGVSFRVTAPMQNQLVKPRYWGTLDDFKDNAFLEFHPDLAVSWEQSNDREQWTFKLRLGVLACGGNDLLIGQAGDGLGVFRGIALEGLTKLLCRSRAGRTNIVRGTKSGRR